RHHRFSLFRVGSTTCRVRTASRRFVVVASKVLLTPASRQMLRSCGVSRCVSRGTLPALSEWRPDDAAQVESLHQTAHPVAAAFDA
ncbi:hypothetical protein CH063_05366, partial [Colletotrichum higginsianum]